MLHEVFMNPEKYCEAVALIFEIPKSHSNMGLTKLTFKIIILCIKYIYSQFLNNFDCCELPVSLIKLGSFRK